MAVNLAYTLVADGPSDRALLPVLDWLLGEHSQRLFDGVAADLSRVRNPPKELGLRIQRALELYPCDLLFVHRDAEKAKQQTRRREILKALGVADHPPAVCVIPVRMTEAWLIWNESAIRGAASNPNGTVAVDVPDVGDVERIVDPKKQLGDLITEASELTGRRRRKLRVQQAIQRLAELIGDFSPLRRAPAFAALEDELVGVLRVRGWSKDAS